MNAPSRQLLRPEPRALLSPECGYWRMRVVKGGPLVAACIRWCETTQDPDDPENDMSGTRSPFLAAFINDKPVDLDRVWHSKGEVIDEAAYRFMVAEAAWTTEYAPTEPSARPTERVNIRQLAIPF